MGLQGNYFFIMLILTGLGTVSGAMAMGLACFLPDVKKVSECMPLVYLPQVIFSGYIIRTYQIPVFLRWIKYFCALKYAMNLVFMTEFRVTGPKCSSSAMATQHCEQLFTEDEIDKNDFYSNIMGLVMLAVGFRILGMVVLRKRAKQFY
jgi:hypothetical protein